MRKNFFLFFLLLLLFGVLFVFEKCLLVLRVIKSIFFLLPAKPDFFFFFPDMESCQFLMSCSRIKELSDTSFSDTDSVIKSPWEELQGIVAEISEALCGSEDLARSDCSVFTQTP